MTIKFRIMSDLHLEFEPKDKEIYPLDFIGEDYLVLAGDIQAGMKMQRWFTRLLKHRSVLYVLGNHEFYNNDYDYISSRVNLFQKWVNQSAESKGYPYRLHILDNSTIEVGKMGKIHHKIKIIGSTLWSLIDPSNIKEVWQGMNDYRVIKKNGKNLSINDTLNEFSKNLRFILTEIKDHNNYDKMIIITHHAPSLQSIHPKYTGNSLNSAFATNLEPYMGEIDLWIHGHTHSNFDYKVGKCRVVCNPKGYDHENKTFDRNFMIEI